MRMYAWSVNDRGQGLLRLDHGWNRDRAIWEKALMEISEAGFEVNAHDSFHCVLGKDTFYLLSPVGENSSRRPISPIP